jgi:hypothetical protein
MALHLHCAVLCCACRQTRSCALKVMLFKPFLRLHQEPLNPHFNPTQTPTIYITAPAEVFLLREEIGGEEKGREQERARDRKGGGQAPGLPYGRCWWMCLSTFCRSKE